MAKYHINPETGKPGKCTATIQECKYKVSDSEHYSSIQEAETAYEHKMNATHGIFNNVKNSKPQPPKAKQRFKLTKKLLKTSDKYRQFQLSRHYKRKRIRFENKPLNAMVVVAGKTTAMQVKTLKRVMSAF